MGLSENADGAVGHGATGVGEISACLHQGFLFSFMKREWPLNVSPGCLSVLSRTMG